MVIAPLILGVLSSAASVIAAVPRADRASTFAGASVSAVFPPLGATDAPDVETFFPDAAQVGHAGPTPTGDEAWVIQTAPVAPLKEDAYPLVASAGGSGQVPVSKSKAKTPFDITRYWGNGSPWWSVGGAWGLPQTTQVTPQGCELTQVHLLHRHGARYPNGDDVPTIFASEIHAAATSTGFNASGPLEFLNTWTYSLGAELLTPFGRQEMFDLGVAFRVKYGHLLKVFTDLPVFRTTSQARMVDSALNFAAGFFGVQQYQSSYHQVIAVEDTGFFSSLEPSHSCPNAYNPAIANLGLEAALTWATVYLNKTIPRLQKHLDGVTLDPTSVIAMQQLCAYETVALGFSAFCDLFTEEEWKAYEYALDLEVWYAFGPGNPTTAAQGLAYVEELAARLTQTPLTESAFNSSGLNRTLDDNDVTFPLNQPIYVDATHDTVITTVLVALNLTSMAAGGPLPLDHIQKGQTYISSQIVPFGSNLVAQVMTCPARASSPKGSFIRLLLNDGAVPLTGLGHCPKDKDGLCPVDTFVKGLKKRLTEIDFQHDCFANYTVSLPESIVDGRAPR